MEQLLAWLERIQGYAKTIGFSLCLVCVIILAIVFFTGGTRGAEGGKKWALNILVGIAILSFGTAIVTSLM